MGSIFSHTIDLTLKLHVLHASNLRYFSRSMFKVCGSCGENCLNQPEKGSFKTQKRFVCVQ